MTEQDELNTLSPYEARERWCPFAREGASAGNRPVEHTGSSADRDVLCIASDCMAWQWRPDGEKGFCGLARR
jgi:hypothetical protein